jgi:hypothetical protein
MCCASGNDSEQCTCELVVFPSNRSQRWITDTYCDCRTCLAWKWVR